MQKFIINADRISWSLGDHYEAFKFNFNTKRFHLIPWKLTSLLPLSLNNKWLSNFQIIFKNSRTSGPYDCSETNFNPWAFAVTEELDLIQQNTSSSWKSSLGDPLQRPLKYLWERTSFLIYRSTLNHVQGISLLGRIYEFTLIFQYFRRCYRFSRKVPMVCFYSWCVLV